MRVIKFCSFIAVFGLCIVSAGCSQKFRYEKTDTITMDEAKSYTIDGPKSDQKLKVEVTSDEPVMVIVHLEGDKADVKGKIEPTKEGNCEVNIPAGKTFVIVVAGNKKATFTLKVNSV